MNHWKFLAISDTHLGEDSSILSYKPGRSRLYEALVSKLGDGQKFEVDELVLVGDIPDRTLSSTSQIMTQTYDLMKTLFAAATIKRVVYIPGNHDHTLWTDYVTANKFTNRTISEGPEGDQLLVKGDYSKAQSAPELLTMLFGYSQGTAESLWRDLNAKKEVEFCFANPLYAKEVEGKTYVFTHGTHFRRDVTSLELLKKLGDYIQVDKLFGLEVDTSASVAGATDLKDLEGRVTPFVDTLRPSSKNQATREYDKLWYLLTSISGKFKNHRRHTPEDHGLWSLAQLQSLNNHRIRKLDGHEE